MSSLLGLTAEVVRAAGTDAEDAALDALAEWFATTPGRRVLMETALSTHSSACRRGWFGRIRPPAPAPRQRVVVPLYLCALGEIRSSLVGVEEKNLSERERQYVDGEFLGLADWDPLTRVLTDASGVGVVLPDDISLSEGAMALVGAHAALWPEEMMEDPH